MTKPAILLALVGMLGSTALAGPPKPTKPLKKPNCGESYDLFAPSHHVATPTGDRIEVAKKLLTQLQVNQVVKAKLADVQYCWNRLPATQRRSDMTAILRLAIDATGEVETVDVAGSVPQDAARCISAAAAAWQFPVADQAGDFEYAVALRTM